MVAGYSYFAVDTVEFNIGKFLFYRSVSNGCCVPICYDVCAETNQIEDPRLKWRSEQERMIKEYLADASQDLAVSFLIILLKLLDFLQDTGFECAASKVQLDPDLCRIAFLL